jgi:hypothetical protein
LDRYVSGELSAAERLVLEAHLSQCAQCCMRQDALLREREAFLARVPSWDAFRVARETPRASVARPRRARRWLAAASIGLAASALLGLLVREPPPAVRLKGGGPRLSVFVKHGQAVTLAEDATRVRPGDLLRVAYSTPIGREFALLHRDARTATVYYPASASKTQAIAAGHEVPLDFSIELDAQPGPEQLYGLFCDRPTPLAPLLAALRRGDDPRPPAHCQLEHVRLTKLPGEP